MGITGHSVPLVTGCLPEITLGLGTGERKTMLKAGRVRCLPWVEPP